jgi:hypothetical protein
MTPFHDYARLLLAEHIHLIDRVEMARRVPFLEYLAPEAFEPRLQQMPGQIFDNSVPSNFAPESTLQDPTLRAAPEKSSRYPETWEGSIPLNRD